VGMRALDVAAGDAIHYYNNKSCKRTPLFKSRALCAFGLI
jgi:hypothetical protein